MKCPICGNELGVINNGTTNEFVVLAATKDHEINLNEGTPVKLLGCKKCGFTTLFKPEIIQK